MKIAVSGASGLVGRSLCRRLLAEGHLVAHLVRRPIDAPPEAGRDIHWEPLEGRVDSGELAGCDAVIHLAGENVGAGRWNKKRKDRILESRVRGTETLCRGLAELQQPPATLLCASAIGYYGDREDKQLVETDTPGKGFLADVCRRWEAATSIASTAGIRVVNLRFGVVLSPEGGALERMLDPFRWGVGGKIGTGRQYLSWIGLGEAVDALHLLLGETSIAGPVNLVNPAVVTNLQFTKALGRVLGRPTILPLPAFAVKLLFGEMGRELLLASTRVRPVVLEQSGFQFRHADVEAALRALLKS
ncbi:MAG: TIGR01777 family oxidoreductase [Phycisphaerae bacterium]|nr:TIGR01777 family oxidoreductase [Phycisphaerae bacterium]